MENTKWRPSGKKDGQLTPSSWRDRSAFITVAGVPPPADTRLISDAKNSANRISPSRFHAPPPPFASHSVVSAPSARAIFFSFPCAKNPMNRLSGDQKGDSAPSVPGNDLAVSKSSERIQSDSLPSEKAVKAMWRPSGDIAGEPTPVRFSGKETETRMACASMVGRLKSATANQITPSASAPVTVQAIQLELKRRGSVGMTAFFFVLCTAGAFTSRLEPDDEINAFSTKPKSPAD